MENSPASSSLPTILSGLAAIASLIGIPVSAILTHFLTRRYRSAKTHQTNAETGKSEAQSRQIDSAIVMRAYTRLDEYEEITRRQSGEITKLEHRVLDLEYEGRTRDAEIKRLQAEAEILNLQIQRARAAGFLTDREPHSPNPAASPTSS